MTTSNPKETVLWQSLRGSFVICFFLCSSILPNALAQPSEGLWPVSAFLEEPNGSYEVLLDTPSSSIVQMARELQPKKRKSKIQETYAELEMTYVVYEKAMIGSRPFGRVRYKLVLREESEGLRTIFRDFKFRKIERSARYGKLEEVGGRPKAPSDVKADLTDTQWGILRWKTEGVINRKLAMISGNAIQPVETE